MHHRDTTVSRCGGFRIASGFSLIETLVGLMLGLIGTLAMLSAFAVFEQQKRRTTAGNDAVQNGSYAAYLLERELRNAGSGLSQAFHSDVWGCPIRAIGAGSTVLPASSFPAPFSR